MSNDSNDGLLLLLLPLLHSHHHRRLLPMKQKTNSTSHDDFDCDDDDVRDGGDYGGCYCWMSVDELQYWYLLSHHLSLCPYWNSFRCGEGK